MVKHIYWSRFKRYRSCPQSYLWHYGYGDIDLGDGPGRPKPLDKPESEHNAITGRVMSTFVEYLYNQRWYMEPHTMKENTINLIRSELDNVIHNAYIDWSKTSKTVHTMEQDCMDAAFNYYRTMKHNKLLGTYAKSEVRLKNRIEGDKFPIGGIADLIIKNGEGIHILDGKMTVHKSKYCEKDQLIWYALLFWLEYGVMPNKIGWIWFSHPYDEEKGEQGVEYIDYTKQDMLELATEAKDMQISLRSENFEATPKPSNCRLCPFESVCTPRIEQRKANAAKRNAKKKEHILNTNGIVEVNLDAL